MDGVWGTVNYLAAGSTRNRLYVAPGEQRATARYEPRQVFVGDGRACQDDLTLDAAGFTLVGHQTSVPRLDDPAALDGAYTGEGRNLVRTLTGADRVVSLGWIMRRTTPDRRGALPPAPDVHVDLHTTEIAHRYARVHARSALPAPGTYRRAVWTSLWRAFSPPPQDWPLAVCERTAGGTSLACTRARRCSSSCTTPTTPSPGERRTRRSATTPPAVPTLASRLNSAPSPTSADRLPTPGPGSSMMEECCSTRTT
jgi:hypothetical protein